MCSAAPTCIRGCHTYTFPCAYICHVCVQWLHCCAHDGECAVHAFVLLLAWVCVDEPVLAGWVDPLSFQGHSEQEEQFSLLGSHGHCKSSLPGETGFSSGKWTAASSAQHPKENPHQELGFLSPDPSV